MAFIVTEMMLGMAGAGATPLRKGFAAEVGRILAYVARLRERPAYGRAAAAERRERGE